MSVTQYLKLAIWTKSIHINLKYLLLWSQTTHSNLLKRNGQIKFDCSHLKRCWYVKLNNKKHFFYLKGINYRKLEGLWSCLRKTTVSGIRFSFYTDFQGLKLVTFTYKLRSSDHLFFDINEFCLSENIPI